MQVDHRPGLRARRHHRLPVARVDGRQAQQRRVLAERHRVEAAFGVLVDHLRADLGVEQPRQLARNDAVGVRAGPGLDVPVVPGPHRRHRQVAVVGHLLQPLAGEPGQERREVQRGVDAVEVHVRHAGMDIPGAAAHFVEPGRLEAVLRHRPADDGVEADVRQRLAVVHPGLSAVLGVDHPRRAVGELAAAPVPRRCPAARRCGRRRR